MLSEEELRFLVRRIIGYLLTEDVLLTVVFSIQAFDVIYVMTGGRFKTDVVATLFFKEAFVVRDFGVGAALAVVLLLWIVPIMLISIRRFQFQEETR